VLLDSNAGCYDCLQQFLNPGAAARCLAPFLSASCNHELTCALECSTDTCGGCSAGAKSGCESTAFQAGEACSPYISGYFCARAAFGGPGAFCDAKTIGDIGLWLQGVGAYYCSP